MRAKKIEVVTRMVQNGYCLFNETVEQFADRFDLPTLLCFEESFSANRQKQTATAVYFFTFLFSNIRSICHFVKMHNPSGKCLCILTY